jgi:hypothetical protein
VSSYLALLLPDHALQLSRCVGSGQGVQGSIRVEDWQLGLDIQMGGAGLTEKVVLQLEHAQVVAVAHHGAGVAPVVWLRTNEAVLHHHTSTMCRNSTTFRIRVRISLGLLTHFTQNVAAHAALCASCCAQIMLWYHVHDLC